MSNPLYALSFGQAMAQIGVLLGILTIVIVVMVKLQQWWGSRYDGQVR